MTVAFSARITSVLWAAMRLILSSAFCVGEREASMTNLALRSSCHTHSPHLEAIKLDIHSKDRTFQPQ